MPGHRQRRPSRRHDHRRRGPESEGRTNRPHQAAGLPPADDRQAEGLHHRGGREAQRPLGQLPAQGPRGAARLQLTSSWSRRVPSRSCRPSARAVGCSRSPPSAARRSRRSWSSATSARSRPAFWPFSSTATWSAPWSSSGTRSRPSRKRPGVSSRPSRRPTGQASSWTASAPCPRPSRKSSAGSWRSSRHSSATSCSFGAAATRRSSSTRTLKGGSARPLRPGARGASQGVLAELDFLLVELGKNMNKGLLATTFFSNFGELRNA